MMYYKTKENDMLDFICWKHYGSSSGAIEVVLKANSGLAEYELLPAGLIIKLPVIQKETQKQVVKLWD
ncbi:MULTISPECIES: tail protein X [unclassified Wolbachia]|uniref:tail protein X n=1 Tax=unclassified Wolbachia TaxID=2640676 RepID=UPI0021F851A6|nr:MULTISPECIES: tail protein X [unclassified Wolbachia]